jgi:hypothetical protein
MRSTGRPAAPACCALRAPSAPSRPPRLLARTPQTRKEAAQRAAAAIAARLASQGPPEASGSGPAAAAGPAPQGPAAPSEEDRRRAALSVSGEEAFLRRGQMGRPPPSQPSGATSTSGGLPGLSGGLPGLADYADDPPAPGLGGGGLGFGAGAAAGSGAGGAEGGGGVKGMSLAEKLLNKMGWKAGEGLGRNKQGISTPLVAQKVGRAAGAVDSLAGAGGALLLLGSGAARALCQGL